jgi:hypothetical protein
LIGNIEPGIFQCLKAGADCKEGETIQSPQTPPIFNPILWVKIGHFRRNLASKR